MGQCRRGKTLFGQKSSEHIEPRLFQSDASGRLVLPFKSMRAVKDVVVMDIGK